MTNKDVVDVVAISGAIGAFTDVLPAIAAFFAIVWTLIRIYEWARVRIFGLDQKETFK